MHAVLGTALALAAVVSLEFRPPASGQPSIPEGRAVIRGPGLERPLEISGQPFFDLIYLAGLLPDWSPPPPGQHVPPPKAVRLGTPYDLFYTFPLPGQGPVPLVQAVYFGTSDGIAWIRTVADQGIPLKGGGRLRVPKGWWRSPVLDDFLRGVALAEGLTGFPPDVAPTAGGPSNQTVVAAPREAVLSDEGFPAGTRTLVGIAALGLLMLIGALGSRPSREGSGGEEGL